jgi:DNA-binding MarR family transcriptional regulator
MPAAAPTPDHHKPRRAQDLGIVDGLVQLSFLVQGVLGRVAGGHDLSILQMRLLGVLRDREPGMAQLANLLGLDKSSTTGLIDRAERRGLVLRTPVPEDRRAVHVLLTAEGRRLIAVLGSEVERQLAEVVGDLTETNRKRFSLLVSQVLHHDAAVHGIDLTPGPLAPGPDPTTPEGA